VPQARQRSRWALLGGLGGGLGVTQLVLGQVLNGAIIGAMYGIIALGITLTFGITGIVNFALGEFMMIGAYATYALAERGGLSYPMAVVPACLIAAAAGYLSNKAFFRFTRNNLVNGLLVSIGLISVFESAAMLLWTATPVEMHFVLPGALRVGDIGLPKMKLVVFAVIVVVIVATYLALAAPGSAAPPSPTPRIPRRPCSWACTPRASRAR
jgi:branched-chain amino acid transport system permease protein